MQHGAEGFPDHTGPRHQERRRCRPAAAIALAALTAAITAFTAASHTSGALTVLHLRRSHLRCRPALLAPTHLAAVQPFHSTLEVSRRGFAALSGCSRLRYHRGQLAHSAQRSSGLRIPFRAPIPLAIRGLQLDGGLVFERCHVRRLRLVAMGADASSASRLAADGSSAPRTGRLRRRAVNVGLGCCRMLGRESRETRRGESALGRLSHRSRFRLTTTNEPRTDRSIIYQSLHSRLLPHGHATVRICLSAHVVRTLELISHQFRQLTSYSCTVVTSLSDLSRAERWGTMCSSCGRERDA